MHCYCIYGHYCRITGKWYIGQTVYGDNPEKRWGKNGCKYRTQTLIGKAIKKHGWDSFDHIIFENNLSLEEANEKEKFYIKLYNSNNPKFGYNLTEGGEGTVGLIPSEKTRKKLSEAHKNPSEETRKKMSEAHKGKRIGKENSFYGKHHSEKTRKKLSEANKGEKNPNYGKHNFANENNPHARKIICIETGKVFKCIKTCAEEMNISCKNISMCCSRNAKTTDNPHQAKGYHFIYYTGDE